MPTLPVSTRYANFDNTVIYFVPTIAATTMIPTKAEIDAGTDLTGEISDVSGFTVSGSDIDAPDLKSEFVSKVPGRTSAEDSSLTFYADEVGNDARDVLPYKTTGYIVIMHGGYVATQPMDVFPIRVRSVGKPVSVSDTLATVVIGCSITREPVLDAPIPSV